jgi:hypothetical protein
MNYTVSANLYNGRDYTGHWEGGTFDTYDEAYRLFLTWMPPKDEVRQAVIESVADGIWDGPLYDHEIEVAVWDDGGNLADENAFYTKDAFMEDAVLEILLPEAVLEMWYKPMQDGLKFCCEDIVNYLAYEGTNAILGKKKGVVVYEGDEFEIFDAMMGLAIELVRERADEMGIEFVDVWS